MVCMAFITEHEAAKITHRLRTQHHHKCLLPCKERYHLILFRYLCSEFGLCYKDLFVKMEYKLNLHLFTVIMDEDRYI